MILLLIFLMTIIFAYVSKSSTSTSTSASTSSFTTASSKQYHPSFHKHKQSKNIAIKIHDISPIRKAQNQRETHPLSIEMPIRNAFSYEDELEMYSAHSSILPSDYSNHTLASHSSIKRFAVPCSYAPVGSANLDLSPKQFSRGSVASSNP